jgi:crotonobetainyl-CoA:carnitine CoA-transferase CaiB-like acyl-CoA transferase
MENNGALQGVTVLDMARLLPGPYCSMILADHGARVIAVEDKRFMADGLFFSIVNRNKEHMSLDLKTDAGREIFFKLVAQADVFMEGFRPGVVDRLGIDYKTVCQINPQIVYCAITGYGQNGPCRDRVGHDVNYLSTAGVLDLMGEAQRLPSIPGVQIADMAGGGMNAAIGILLALFARERTGKGQYIDISMTDGMVGLLPAVLYFQQLTGEAPRRGDAFLAHHYACYNTYATADGRYLSIGAVEHRFWKKLCEVLDAPQYSDLQYDEARREEIIAFMRETFRTKTLDQWTAILGDRDICWSRIQNLDEVIEDPLFRQREMVVEAEDEKGNPVKTLGVPVKLSKTPGSIRSAPVPFGASTIAILRELGYSDEVIADFQKNDVF